MRGTGGLSVLVTAPYAVQLALLLHGAPCSPSDIQGKELRTKTWGKAKPKKEVRVGQDGQRYTAAAGPAPSLDMPRDAGSPNQKRPRPESHKPLFGKIGDSQGKRIGFPPLRERVPKELDLTIATIDQAQGREADVVITCTTRANTDGDMGFVNEAERWNVNISRAISHLIIVGNVTGYRSAREAEFPAMLTCLLEANCVKKVDFNPHLPGVQGIEFTDLSFGDIKNLPKPLVGPNALNEMRSEIFERAAEQVRKRRRLDKDKAWEDRQGIEPPEAVGHRDTFLAREAELFRRIVEHPVFPSLDNHLSGCGVHHNYVGDVPHNKMDCDLKEISQEGFCQNAMFMDPGNLGLAICEWNYPHGRLGHSDVWP